MKRDYNDFRRITRSQTAAAVTKGSQQPPPLKRLKVVEPVYRGFDVLPNELVTAIVEYLPPNLDTITMMVCKRWKGAIGWRTKRHNPQHVLYWATKNPNMDLLAWVAPRVNLARFYDLFVKLANYFVITLNLRDLRWLCNIVGNKKQLLSQKSIHTACMYGDLAFVKGVMKVFKKDANYKTRDMFYSATFENMCESGDLEIAQWILEMDQEVRGQYIQAESGHNRYPNDKFRNLCAVARRVSEKGHLHVVKWIYTLFASDEDRLKWIKQMQASSQPCTAEIKQWIAGLSEIVH